MARRSDVFNPSGSEYHSWCGCHYKTAAIAIGCLVGIPVCLTAFQQALAAFHKESYIIIFILPWSLIEVICVVSFFIGIFTYNSAAMTPFIWIMYLLVFYYVFLFGLGVLFLVSGNHTNYPKITEFIVPTTISHKESVDFRELMSYYTLGMATASIVFTWMSSLLIRARIYVRDYENYNKNHPVIRDPDSITTQ